MIFPEKFVFVPTLKILTIDNFSLRQEPLCNLVLLLQLYLHLVLYYYKFPQILLKNENKFTPCDVERKSIVIVSKYFHSDKILILLSENFYKEY